MIEGDEKEGEQGMPVACRLVAGNNRKAVSLLMLLTFLLECMSLFLYCLVAILDCSRI